MKASVPRIRELAAEGLNKSSIAFIMGISHQRVSQIVAKHGIECANTNRHKQSVKAKLIERMKAECTGMTRKEAAAHLAITMDRLGAYRSEAQFNGFVPAQYPRRQLSERTKRIIDEAPALAARGLYKAEAARELGVPADIFTLYVLRYLPDVQWKDGRSVDANKRLSPHNDVIMAEAQKLAARGLSKAEAARELGVPTYSFNGVVRKRLPHIKWRSGGYGPRKSA